MFKRNEKNQEQDSPKRACSSWLSSFYISAYMRIQFIIQIIFSIALLLSLSLSLILSLTFPIDDILFYISTFLSLLTVITFLNLSSRIFLLYFPFFLSSPFLYIYIKLHRFIFSVISYPLFYQLFLSSSFSVDYLLHLSIFIFSLPTSTIFNSFLLMFPLFFFNISIIPPDRG